MTTIDMDMDEELDSEETAPGSALRFGLILLIGLAIITGMFWAISNRRTTPGFVTNPAHTAQTVYISTLSETHTGRRLARLEDFLVQHPDSPQFDTARIRRNVLRAHEQSAWAEYTKARFDLHLSPEEKTSRLSAYIRAWGNFTRKQDIEDLHAETSNEDALAFGKPKSKYADARDTVMVGDSAPNIRFIPPSPLPNRQAPVIAPQPTPKKLRVRSDRTPKYPPKAKRRGVEAVVILALDIDDKGKVRRTHLVRVDAKSYHKDFAKAAQRAARRTRFHPMKQGGETVPVQGYKRTYRFEIGG